ncbi:G-type lectin S-receptor-like serine/threonine-protein kinase At1g11300 isoform X2 [Coffea arabica]|uniref:Receptor-like serine/threonine-protein kinase n=1 Tax=Coffea arabica TaxID=13443 RepID=A0ABM4VMW8_COFAR
MKENLPSRNIQQQRGLNRKRKESNVKCRNSEVICKKMIDHFLCSRRMKELTNLVPLLLLFACFCTEDCRANDTITITKPIRDPESVVSAGQTYKLGFFSPANTSNRYVGIIFNNFPQQTVLWVANRNQPLNDSGGIFSISEDGNLTVLNGQKKVLWSSNASNSVANCSAQLLDTGNLVLRDNSNGMILWESFRHPTDTIVCKMRLGASTKNKNRLTSWKSPSDPSIGSFSLGFDHPGIPEVFIWDQSKPLWRSGPWDGNVFIGVPGMYSGRHVLHMVNENTDSASLTYDCFNDSVLTYYHVLTSSGIYLENVWNNDLGDSTVTWSSRKSECDVYSKCGPFGICNPQGSPICTCLKGFEPRDKEEWNRGNWTGGCLRKALLQCQGNISGGQEAKPDGYLKLNNVKVPDSSYLVGVLNLIREEECGDECSNNCSCIAYAYPKGVGCMHWSGHLIDVQQFPFDGTDLYVRVAYSELGETIIRMKDMLSDSEDQLHLYGNETLANATNTFHVEIKLGKGGFGSVYKGKLIDGQEIAVKRLSNSSTQGIEEFKNEVLVISKLQHRNLVRLLGCCVEREEKMLVYEFMPNKSLDAYLFDICKHDLLAWNRRTIIIEGICRGLLYLHRDSRLKIIHRDLKASNILLDGELIPKISDFGLARIFRGNQDQDNTNRVAGTYGYMAPEYAMRGKFSEKSDVYSFGVLLLEIVSGKRNTSFGNEANDHSLVEYAWKLWNAGETVKLIDPRIFDPCIEMEVLRYIHVGLLCVQKHAKDRPNVSNVLSMLNSEIVEIPCPNLPAYNAIFCPSKTVHPEQGIHSPNDVSITAVVGR